MKKNLRLLLMIFVMLLLIGCNKNSNNQQDNLDNNVTTEESSKQEDETKATLESDKQTEDEITDVTEVTKETQADVPSAYGKAADYISFEKNVRYYYEGVGNEYATYDTYVDYVTEDRIQFRTDNGGTQTAKVIEKADGKLSQVLLRGEIYYRENLTSKEDSNRVVLLMDPIQIGTTWNVSNSRKRTITNTEVTISTPIGDFTTIEVTTEDGKDKTIEYYAKDIGLIKILYKSDDYEVSSTLSKIEKNASLEQTITFFYPDAEGKVIETMDRKLTFKTNDITRIAIEKEYKKLTAEVFKQVLSENTQLNSLYLSKENVVYADFSKELVDEMNAGAGIEALILQSITNTLGSYYGVEEVYITVDNKPYESGHISLEKGETLKVNMDEVVE